MSSTTNKEEKKCCDLCEGNHSLFTGNARIDCPCHTPQSVEEEECWHREITSDGLNAQCTKCKQEFAPKDSFFEIKICTRCGNNEFRAIPQSNTLGTTMEERFDYEFSWLQSEMDTMTDDLGSPIPSDIKRFINKEISQSKAETIKEIRRKITSIYIEQEKDQSGRIVSSEEYEFTPYSKGFNQALKTLSNLLSKDIEQ